MDFHQWPRHRALHADDLANPDHDAFANLIEYARGTSPLAADPPLAGELHSESDSEYLALRVSRDAIHAGVSYSIQASGDLVNWTSTGLITLANTPLLLHVRDFIAWGTPGQGRRFMRLKITTP